MQQDGAVDAGMTGAPEASAAEAAWRQAVALVLRGNDPARLIRHSRDGLPIAPLDAPWPAADAAYPAEAMGRPARPWQVVQRIDHPDPVAANRLAHEDLEGGANGLELVSGDAPAARGFGLALHQDQMIEQGLAGIHIGAIALRLDPGPDCFDQARRLAGVAARLHPATETLNLDFGVDPVGISAVSGARPPARDALGRDMAALHDELRAGGFVSPIFRADGRVWHEAGASEAQELAALLASGVESLRLLETGGISPARAGAALSFTLVADADQLMTIAKCRSLRRLWRRIGQACGLAPLPMQLHGETTWRMMTRTDPQTNILRGACAAFGAAIGGVDSLTVLPFTAALGLPDGDARRLARNTQIVLAEEAHLWRVADPVAGAGAFEAMTEALTRAAWTLFQEIERHGGIAESLRSGQLQARIAASRQARAADVREGRDALVGTTIFKPPGPVDASVLLPFRIDGSVPADVPSPSEPLRAQRLSEGFEAIRGEAA